MNSDMMTESNIDIIPSRFLAANGLTFYSLHDGTSSASYFSIYTVN